MKSKSLRNKRSSKPKVKNQNAFKNWINSEVVGQYADLVLDPKEFKSDLNKKINKLELRQRVRLISAALGDRIPDSEYQKFLKQAFAWVLENDLTGFKLWPLLDFVENRGQGYCNDSLLFMKMITERFTAEFAIRPYLLRHQDSAYDFAKQLSRSPNEHHRRLASEGTRPRLPWGIKLRPAVEDPSRGLAVLENLKFDDSLYVRKSVANHLNDISKDHPELVIKTLKSWLKQAGKNQNEKLDFIIRRALRNLIKAGHPGALALVGVKVDVADSLLCRKAKISDKVIRLNQPFYLQIEIENSSSKDIVYVLDFEIHFKKANGSNSPKVFKWSTGKLVAGQVSSLRKNMNIKPITTRVYYSGKHWVVIKLNGQPKNKFEFDLKI